MTTATHQLSERETKARDIAARTQLIRNPNNTWLVPSQTGTTKQYTVNPDPESPSCSCPDFEYRRQRCKHVLAVEIVLKREIDGRTDADRNGDGHSQENLRARLAELQQGAANREVSFSRVPVRVVL
jgi:hypothetical protein